MPPDNHYSPVRLIQKDALRFQDVEVFRYDIFSEDLSLTVGYCYLIGNSPRQDDTGNIGYCIDEKYRRRGYGKSACRSLLKLAGIRGMSEVYIACRTDNRASERIIEYLGGVLAGNTDAGLLLWRIDII